MSLTPSQRALFQLLKEHQLLERALDLNQIQEATNWKGATVRTYISKKLKPYLEEVSQGQYRVHGVRGLEEKTFAAILSQSDAQRQASVESPWNENLAPLNPWWTGKPSLSVPLNRRWLFRRLYRSLRQGLAPATVLRGPRRVGKTVLLRQVIGQLLHDGVPGRRILYVPFDELPSLLESEVILKVVRTFERDILKTPFNESGEPCYLILDEVQNLEGWAAQVKHLVDNFQVRVLITGSSSLRIGAEIDQLAGRLATLDIGPLLPREIHILSPGGFEVSPYWEDNGGSRLLQVDFWRAARAHCQSELAILEPAFARFAERGGYPIGIERVDLEWDELTEWLRENVVVRALEHDMIKLGWRDREEARLLFEVLRLACRYAGQSPGLPTLRQGLMPALGGQISERQISDALEFLEGSRLLRLVRSLEHRGRKSGAGPKLCLCDLTLRAAWMQEKLSLQDHGPLVGSLAESVLGYSLTCVSGVEVATYPQRSDEEPEVDFVLTIGAGRIPVEVKYQASIDPHRDVRGLRGFLKRFPEAPFGLLVTRKPVDIDDPRIVALPLSWLLWLR